MMTNKNLILVFFLLAVITAIFATYTYVAPTPPLDGANSVKLRLKWLNQAQFAGFYVAKEEGLYESEGLDVSIYPGGIDFPAVQMVTNGNEDFGVTGADQVLLARAKGIPVVAVAVIYRKNPFVLFSKKSSGIQALKDFANKRVGVKLGGNEELLYRAMLLADGVEVSSVIEVPVKYDMSLFYEDSVLVWPGYAINEPIAARDNGYDLNIFRPSDYDVNVYADVLFTTEDNIENRPGIVRSFVSMSLKGWKMAIENPNLAVEATLKSDQNLVENHQKKMFIESIDLIDAERKRVGQMEGSDWRKLHDLLVAAGSLQPLDVSSAFTNDFVSPQ